MAKDEYCPKCRGTHSVLLMECPTIWCAHSWAHIEDHHVICRNCKKTADLCWTCEGEKTKTRDGGLVCLKCNPQ